MDREETVAEARDPSERQTAGKAASGADEPQAQSEMDTTLLILIEEIYGEVPTELADGLYELTQERVSCLQPISTSGDLRVQRLWDHRDSVLITYADQIQDRDHGTPLQNLHRFLLQQKLAGVLQSVHLLPFFPSTSDDGFSVADYLRVESHAGTWQDIEALGHDFDLMFDLVLNHCSQQHDWFQRFLKQEDGFRDYFLTADPATNLSTVTRPRSLPLLTPFETAAGQQYVWTTFSADQVDLNYGEPMVLLEMARTLVQYLKRGARIIRLDAIAYLWKEISTNCIHLRQTHAVVKLFRRLVELVCPGALLLTETNVPHQENVSYFGHGDEAHLVYQFSLPPLLLDAVHNEDTSILAGWLADIRPPFECCNFFNFTASHDGIGVRPLEGLVATERLDRLVRIVLEHGGRISTRDRPDGTQSPYELNITYMDAVADAEKISVAEHVRRFMATQATMLGIQGIPGIYFHSLVGTANDQRGVAATGLNRSINRRKFTYQWLTDAIADETGRMGLTFNSYRRLLQIRSGLTSMHPDASQRVLELPNRGMLGWVRDEGGHYGGPLVCLANLSSQPQSVSLERSVQKGWIDHLDRLPVNSPHAIPMAPYQVRWLGPPEDLL